MSESSDVNEVMEESFEQMLEDSIKTIHNGEVVDGTVIGVKENEIILNIGYKSDGILTRQEYSNNPSVKLTEEVKEGDELTVKVLKVNDGEGQVLLSLKRLIAEKGNEKIREAFESEAAVTAPVTQILNGGLGVDVEGARVFIPASLVSDTYEKDLSKYKDQEIEFRITEFNPKRNRIIGNRKMLILEEKRELREKLLAQLHVGDVIEGTVKNVTHFGAFIDLGGVDGLLHISEMSWGRVDNPKKLFAIGDPVKVLVKNIQDEKIALSLKFPETNPWLTAAENFAVSTVITGKVARMTDFGAFVELAPGVDALLHVSQISRNHVDKPSDVLSIGQEVTAKIVDLNLADHKISLSLKALEKDEPQTVYTDPEEAAEEPAAEEAVPSETAEAVESVVEEAAESAPEPAAEEVSEETPEAADAVEEAAEAPATEEAEEVTEAPAEEAPVEEEPAGEEEPHEASEDASADEAAPEEA